METVARTLDELTAEAARLVHTLVPREDGATLVTLSGELGAGKTAFVKEVAKALGVEDTVTSPTFVLEKIYRLPADAPFKQLVHIDAYRLEGASGLTALGFDELMRESSNLILLEWPERVALDEPPSPATRIAMRLAPDGSRAITYA